MTESESRLDRIERLLEQLAGRQEVQHVNIESLHASVSELHATALTDGENIRALARIAELHERRLTDLEGGQ